MLGCELGRDSGCVKVLGSNALGCITTKLYRTAYQETRCNGNVGYYNMDTLIILSINVLASQVLCTDLCGYPKCSD